LTVNLRDTIFWSSVFLADLWAFALPELSCRYNISRFLLCNKQSRARSCFLRSFCKRTQNFPPKLLAPPFFFAISLGAAIFSAAGHFFLRDMSTFHINLGYHTPIGTPPIRPPTGRTKHCCPRSQFSLSILHTTVHGLFAIFLASSRSSPSRRGFDFWALPVGVLAAISASADRCFARLAVRSLIRSFFRRGFSRRLSWLAVTQAHSLGFGWPSSVRFSCAPRHSPYVPPLPYDCCPSGAPSSMGRLAYAG